MPTNPITIRQANEADLEVLCRLYYEFHEFHAHHLPDYLRSLGESLAQERVELNQKIRQIIWASDSTILVAEDSGSVIGFAEIYLKQIDLTNRAINPSTYAHLQSLSVTETFRRKGIGAQLLEAAEAWARMHGALELRLDIWEFSAGPLKFYQKYGYRTYRRGLTKTI